MKYLLTALLALFLAAPLVVGDTSSNATFADDEAIGSMPRRPVKLQPGDCATNQDGVTACNGANSNGLVRMNPETGTSGDPTTVTAQSNSKFSVDGIDANDTVDVGHHSEGRVAGESGTVTISGNSSVTVANDGTNGQTITVQTPTGTHSVGNGQTQTFNT